MDNLFLKWSGELRQAFGKSKACVPAYRGLPVASQTGFQGGEAKHFCFIPLGKRGVLAGRHCPLCKGGIPDEINTDTRVEEVGGSLVYLEENQCNVCNTRWSIRSKIGEADTVVQYDTPRL